jgi:hypothetical protein
MCGAVDLVQDYTSLVMPAFFPDMSVVPPFYVQLLFFFYEFGLTVAATVAQSV